MSTRLEQVEKYGRHTKGRKELIEHLNGKSLYGSEAIIAKCYDCMGYYGDGEIDCEDPECPLYLYMPFKK